MISHAKLLSFSSPHRLAASQKWRGGHNTVFVGVGGHPHQLHQEDFRPLHQGAGLPPPSPAPGGHGGLQPGAVRPARIPGADPGGLQRHAQIWRPDR